MNFSIFAGAMLMLLGAWLWVSLRRDARKGAASLTWPKATGYISESELKSHNNEQGTTTYSIHLRYRFDVASKSYQGNRIAFAGDPTQLTRQQETLSRYPVGASVSVSYDPTNPRQAVLEPGQKIPSRPPVLLFAIVGAGALLSLYGFLA